MDAQVTVRSLHDKAMELAMQATIQRHEGRSEDYRRLCGEAYEFELQAASTFPRALGREPSRGILYRSAAWLAHNAGRFQEAFDAAQEGIANHPPAWLQAELAEVINAAWSELEAKRMADEAER